MEKVATNTNIQYSKKFTNLLKNSKNVLKEMFGYGIMLLLINVIKEALQ